MMTTAVKSILRYPGGKSRLMREMSQYLPKQHFEHYIEPMVGGGSIFFHYKSIGLADSYWINDLYSSLISFWKCAQNQYTCSAMISILTKYHKKINGSSRCAYNLYKQWRTPLNNPLYEAVRFFYANRCSFSGATDSGGFSAEASIKRFTKSAIKRLFPLPEILANVKITNCDIFDIWDSFPDNAFIVLDPPYTNVSKLYGHKGNLHNFDHARLAKLLTNTRHRFFLTYNADILSTFPAYKQFNLIYWSPQYSMANGKKGKEVIITNYDT